VLLSVLEDDFAHIFYALYSSDIQQDLTYARWAELKHGRICMLALVGMVVQQSGLHFPGEQFTNTDIFGAISSVGFAGNVPIFLAIGTAETINYGKHYDGSTAGEIGWEGIEWKNLTDKEKAFRKESEVVHCRLAMIAFVGAITQTLLFNQPLISL
jgi:hypothetical protein